MVLSGSSLRARQRDELQVCCTVHFCAVLVMEHAFPNLFFACADHLQVM